MGFLPVDTVTLVSPVTTAWARHRGRCLRRSPEAGSRAPPRCAWNGRSYVANRGACRLPANL